MGNGKKGGVCWEKKGVDGDRCRDGFLSIRDVQFTTNDERRAGSDDTLLLLQTTAVNSLPSAKQDDADL